MGVELDRLEVQVESQATKANNQLDKLVAKLDAISSSLSHLNSSGLTGLSDAIAKFSKVSTQLSSVKTTDFTRLTKNIDKLANLDTQQIVSASSAIVTLSNAVNSLGSVSANSIQVVDVANSIGKLGGANVQKAITNLPALAASMNDLMTTLSKAPSVSNNIIQMTNALANLAAQGAKVGTAGKNLAGSVNNVGTAMSATTKKAFSLSSALGSVYQKYFILMRGVNKLWNSVDGSMNYVETFNYWNVTLDKIGSEFSSMYEKFGAVSADAYAESFRSRLSELSRKMTGYSISESGETLLTGDNNLGININTLMNFQARIAAVTNSVGQLGEVSVDMSKALSMLSSDLSSFTNANLDSVMTNLQSGLIGQSRALYKYGIDITNATLQTYAYEAGIEKSVSEMTQAEKMQLRLLAILDQSKVAWGDQANTINSVANQYRIFEQQISNTGRTIGNLFLPIVQNALPVVNGFVIAMNRMLTTLGFSLYGDNWLEDLMDGISNGYEDSALEDLTGDLTDAEDSANALKSTLRGFDELNVLNSSNSVFSLGALDSIDLSDAISGALGEYESVWDKAFADMENKAEQFADKIEEAFNFNGVAENLGNLVGTIKDFGDAVSPFTEGFGDGFLGFFGTLAETTLDAFTCSLDWFTDVIENVPPETLETLGNGFGVLVGEVIKFTTLTAVEKKFSALTDGFKTLGTVLNAHPILATFAISEGLLSLIELIMPSQEYKKSDAAQSIADDIKTISDALGISEKTYDATTTLTEIDKIYKKWDEIASKTGELICNDLLSSTN